ncbi:MAG: AMIN domain-containing protein [Candidatus Sulfotelmatobacter sp.]
MPTPRGNRPGPLVLASVLLSLAAPAALLCQSSLSQSSLSQSSLRQSSLRQSSVNHSSPSHSSSVRHVQVLDGKNDVEIEVEGSDRLLPETQVLTGPDRLVVDFPNALPGNAVRNQVVNRGEVKSVRVGLFQSSPPVTRVVLDLKTAQSFQVFPYGRTVIIKVTGNAAPIASTNANGKVEVDDFPPAARPGLASVSYAAAGARMQSPPAPAKSTLEVTFRNGLLSIHANKASLSEILFAVHERTGAEVAVAAGAETEQVVAEYGPAPAPEVLARLLNGSRFNFLILSSPDNPQKLDRVILSLRGSGAVVPLQQMPAPAEEEEVSAPSAANPQNEPAVANAPPQPPKAPPEARPDDNNTPD